MKYFVVSVLIFFSYKVFPQQVSSTVSVSHFANPELYIIASVVCMLTDQHGNPSPGNKYLSIYNKGGASFYLNIPSGSGWKIIKPRQAVILPIINSERKSLVTLKVRYDRVSSNTLSNKVKELESLNKISKTSAFEKSGQGKSGYAIAKILNSQAARLSTSSDAVAQAPKAVEKTSRTGSKQVTATQPVKSRAKLADNLRNRGSVQRLATPVVKPTGNKQPASANNRTTGIRAANGKLNYPKSPAKDAVSKTSKLGTRISETASKRRLVASAAPDTKTRIVETNCLGTFIPAYYTFYYLKVNREVYYSEPFPVPEYRNEKDGQQVLDQAWYCFVGGFRKVQPEAKVYEMLHDPDNDLQTGLIHVRNPFIPSSKIRSSRPYTLTEASAKQELGEWMAFEKKNFPGVKFIKVQM